MFKNGFRGCAADVGLSKSWFSFFCEVVLKILWGRLLFKRNKCTLKAFCMQSSLNCPFVSTKKKLESEFLCRGCRDNSWVNRANIQYLPSGCWLWRLLRNGDGWRFLKGKNSWKNGFVLRKTNTARAIFSVDQRDAEMSPTKSFYTWQDRSGHWPWIFYRVEDRDHHRQVPCFRQSNSRFRNKYFTTICISML